MGQAAQELGERLTLSLIFIIEREAQLHQRAPVAQQQAQTRPTLVRNEHFP